jgi:hypothetical protein
MDFRTFVNSIAIPWSSHNRGDSVNVHCTQIAVVRRRSQNAATPPLMGNKYTAPKKLGILSNFFEILRKIKKKITTTSSW